MLQEQYSTEATARQVRGGGASILTVVNKCAIIVRIEYLVVISGGMPEVESSLRWDAESWRDVSGWMSKRWSSLSSGFFYCVGLVIQEVY